MRLRVRLDVDFAAIEFRTLPPAVKKKVKTAFRRLIVDPLGRHPGLDVRQMRGGGTRTFYRVRLGDWRIVYWFDAEYVYVHRIFHRSEGYAWFDRNT